jgi:hypothetical protein
VVPFDFWSGPFLLKLQSAAVRQSGLVSSMAIDPNDYDYYVVTSRRGEQPAPHDCTALIEANNVERVLADVDANDGD